ncbi:MAG: dihydroorotase [Legionellales bacterium]|nr:dihydroorotase [Legionellales bacterium]|tara:strand:- start:1449 stop:2495 length:1047 start_codon:yes stop_codon:yes gene_type:complete
MQTATTLEIIRPDDWHIHLRDEYFLPRTVHDASRYLGRALVMPNLIPPITTISAAEKYRKRILNAISENSTFNPCMTLYLTNETTIDTILAIKNVSHVLSCKLYPAGVTTNSAHGVSNIKKVYPIFEAMETENIVLNIHGESHTHDVDIFDKESNFIEETLFPICQHFPSLRIVLEHISTKNAVDFVLSQNQHVAATITPQHLLFNRNDLLSGGIKPHLYCLPILKRKSDQYALIAAAISGNPKFFMGTDSAPHSQLKKESSCGCAGVYSAHASIEIYAEIFEQHRALSKLEAFTSIFGANFYQLPVNDSKIKLIKSAWIMPAKLTFGNERLIPLQANKTINWKVETL